MCVQLYMCAQDCNMSMCDNMPLKVCSLPHPGLPQSQPPVPSVPLVPPMPLYHLHHLYHLCHLCPCVNCYTCATCYTCAICATYAPVPTVTHVPPVPLVTHVPPAACPMPLCCLITACCLPNTVRTDAADPRVVLLKWTLCPMSVPASWSLVSQ